MKCIEVTEDKNCCGCRACENICPKKAINMVENKEGFLYPIVDKDKCINCGLCKKVCPWINKLSRNDNYFAEPKCFAAKSNKIDIQKKSSSGGLFTVLANYVLENNGVVVGAEMNDFLKVEHIIVSDKKDLYKIQGSKYVSSNLKNIFVEIRKKLQLGVLVLFSGVPCQIAALLSFLQKEYDNLITCEVICHGVPSQKLFDKYIRYLENKFKGEIIGYIFRSKDAAKWGTYKSLVKIRNGNKIRLKKINADFDPYYSNFLRSNNIRESCYNCKYAKKERVADITLGDFWGIEKILPSFVDYNGVSEIIINTTKGFELFKEVKENLKYETVEYLNLCKENGHLIAPATRSSKRDNWYANFGQDDFFKNIKVEHNIRSYVKIIFPQRFKFLIKKIIKRK